MILPRNFVFLLVVTLCYVITDADFIIAFVLVASHIPYLFHLITLLVSTGPPTIRASIHGLLINIIHSLCTCTYIKFSSKSCYNSRYLTHQYVKGMMATLCMRTARPGRRRRTITDATLFSKRVFHVRPVVLSVVVLARM